MNSSLFFRKLGWTMNLISGVALVGIGLFFIFFRPAFLPEDLTFIGTSSQLDELLPRLAVWLHRVFTVLGSFILSIGFFVIGISYLWDRLEPKKVLSCIFFGVWASSIGVMSAINFSIDSNFKWWIFALAVCWFAGILSLWLEDKLNT